MAKEDDPVDEALEAQRKEGISMQLELALAKLREASETIERVLRIHTSAVAKTVAKKCSFSSNWLLLVASRCFWEEK